MHHKFTRRSVFQLTGAGLALPVIQSNLLENGLMPFTPKFVDLVRNITSVTGTGPVTLGAAVPGYTSLADAVSTGDQFYYCIQGVDKPAEREVGRGTMQADGKIARMAVSGGLTSFSNGTKTIALVTAAEWFSKFEAAGAGGMMAAASRTELAASASGRAFLAEPKRAGNFVFDHSNMSAKVSADPGQGVFVPPASDPSGASGAWVRQYDQAVNVRWFGATGDGATNDSAAFVAAIAFLKAIAGDDRVYYKASPDLFVPAGHYYLGTTALDITHTFRMIGECSNGQQGNSAATRLRWAAGTDGIRVQRYNTSGTATIDASTHYAGDGFALENIRLSGDYSGTEGEFHAIRNKGYLNLRRVVIENWPGDGIFSHNDTGGAGENMGNSNTSYLEQVHITGCRDGLSRTGGDANAWVITALDVTGNRRWGKNCTDFLGGTEIGGHAADNGLVIGAIPTIVSHGGNRYAVKYGQDAGAASNAPSGATADNSWWYYIGAGGVNSGLNIPAWSSGMAVRAGGAACYQNLNARNVLLGAYTEGGQGPIQGVAPTLLIGGMQGAGVRGTLVYLSNYVGALSATSIGSTDLVTGNKVTISPGVLEFGHPSNGTYTLEWFNNDLAWTALRSANVSVWAYRLTGENTTLNIGKRRLDFPNGFGLNDKKILPGTAAPTNGAFVQGDIVLNSAPVAGGPMGWMCVSGGSPGTWKAMANLAA